MGTAFTYQGRLTDGGPAANGIYDLRFAICDSATNGRVVAGPLTNSPAGVTNGLFTLTLDFGEGVFTGEARWLEIGVRTNGSLDDFTTLSPLQPLTPAPYALYAPSAGQAATATLANSVPPGSIGTTALAAGAVDSSRLAAGAVTPTNLSPSVLSNTFWRLDGNAGTTAGAHYLGTSDPQPLELKVNGERALRLETPPSGGPNIIGGHWGNTAAGEGVTIAGGGSAGLSNRVEANYSFVGGGRNHLIQNSVGFSTIGGGDGNSIRRGAYSSTIGGGAGQSIGSNSLASTIGGGQGNSIGASATACTISGGYSNAIQTNAFFATIGGGYFNMIESNAPRATIAALAMNSGRFATAGGVFVTGAAFAWMGGSYPAVGAVGALIYALGMVAIWFAPDTSRKNLED